MNDVDELVKIIQTEADKYRDKGMTSEAERLEDAIRSVRQDIGRNEYQE